MASTYQLKLQVDRTVEVQIGKLGKFCFPAGQYVYTGSAKRGLRARINRHFRKKKLRWHIDYLLNSPGVRITGTRTSSLPECRLNQSTRGEVIVKGFGSSDCRNGCGSHLKFVVD